MKVDLDMMELKNLLLNGNKAHSLFVQVLGSNFDIILEGLDEYLNSIDFYKIDDIRGLINGGALYFVNKEELDEYDEEDLAYIHQVKDDLFMVLDLRYY